MNKIILVPLALLLLLSGCIEITPDTYDEVFLEDGNIYEEGDPLYGLTFILPSYIDTKNGVLIELEISRPDESSAGNYNQFFSSPIEGNLFIDTYAVTLYYPGTWKVNYSIYEGQCNCGNLSLLGLGTFYVKSDETNLASFEVIDFDSPTITNFSFYVNFTIKNVGIEPGTVEINLINSKIQTMETYSLGHTFWSSVEYLEDDGEFSKSIYIPVPSNDMNITLRYNDKEVSQFVKVINPNYPIEETPIVLIVGILMLLTFFGILILVRR